MTKVQGRLALSVVDNLVVVHHQASKVLLSKQLLCESNVQIKFGKFFLQTSMVFDIRLPGIKVSGSMQLGPVVDPMPIQPQTIQVPGTILFDIEC